MTSELLSGPDRFAYHAGLDRSLRLGEGVAVGVSDRTFLLGLVAARDRAGAEVFVNSLTDAYRDMIVSYIEWANGLARALLERTARQPEAKSHLRMAESIRRAETPRIADEVRIELAQLSSARLWNDVEARRRVLVSALNRPQDAEQAFDALAGCARARHDHLVDAVQALCVEAVASLGEEAAVALLTDTLARCSFYLPWWGALERATPEERVVLLAEEFRLHWSGPMRHGSVLIQEEAESYRLVLAPCGSGGALLLRRSSAVRREHRPLLNGATWRNADAAAYCAHCAQNEFISVARFGYLAWATDLNPDPSGPCSWRVFKRPTLERPVCSPTGLHALAGREGAWSSGVVVR